MKKIYLAPEIEEVDIVLSSAILEGSILEYSNTTPSNDSDFDGDATGAARGDWNNIWGEM